MFMNLLPKESVGSIFRVLLVVGCLTPSVAKAGFDWTPPPAAPSAQAPAPVVQDAAPAGPLTPEPDALPVPVGNVEAAPVPHNEPLVVDNTPSAPAPAAEPTPAPVAPVVEKTEAQPPVAATPVEAAPAGDLRKAPAVAETPTPAPTPAPAVASGPVVEGFGKDIPLAIALRDIVPAKYAYSFSPSNIAGSKISWRGGKQWQDVLKDALTPRGLDVSITENAIVIFEKQSRASAVPAPNETMVAGRPDSAPNTNAEPLPLVASQDAPAQETASQPAPTEIRRTASAMDMKSNRKWQARPGTTLRQTLEAWSKESNVELNWSTPYDYPINNAFYFDGEFTQAVDALLTSYGRETPSPKGRLYPNLPEGPSVLMIN